MRDNGSRVGSVAAGQTPEVRRAEEEIARAREQVARSVSALRYELARRFEWREWVRRRPGACLAAAFLVGYLVARR